MPHQRFLLVLASRSAPPSSSSFSNFSSRRYSSLLFAERSYYFSFRVKIAFRKQAVNSKTFVEHTQKMLLLIILKMQLHLELPVNHQALQQYFFLRRFNIIAAKRSQPTPFRFNFKILSLVYLLFHISLLCNLRMEAFLSISHNCFFSFLNLLLSSNQIALEMQHDVDN